MKRLVDQNLISWKDQARRKPLIVRGARQVGKTYSINEFGRKFFPNHFVAVNLEKNPDWHQLFTKNLDAKRIINELEIVTRQKIIPDKTLLFIDEIQTCPQAITALRYFYETYPELAVIAAGSLLEFALGKISFPVGRVQFLDMVPLTFHEFLLATHQDRLAEIVAERDVPITELIHQTLLDQVKTYMFVGGMPESVESYVKTASLKDSFQVHAEIIHAYRQDFSKYTPHVDQFALETVLKGVGHLIGRQIKYTYLAEEAAIQEFSQPTLKKAFELLCQARIVSRVRATSGDGLPLGALARMNRFKAILVDIGLVHSLCGLAPEEEWKKQSLLGLYRGALAEQFVGQEIKAYQGDALYYWSREEKSSQAEVDYLLAHKGKIYPVEVKSGPAGKLKSLHLFLKTYPSSPEGWVFSEAPLAELKAQRLKFIPIYLVGAMSRVNL